MAEKVDQMDPNEKIVEIAIERLRVFENHPFQRTKLEISFFHISNSERKYLVQKTLEL